MAGKAYLQVLRQLLTAGIARIHGDEETHTRVQTNRTAISEHKLLLALTNGAEHTVHLQTQIGSFSNVRNSCPAQRVHGIQKTQ